MYIPSYTIMLPFILLLGRFARFTHYMRYCFISCTTHPTKGWLGSFVNIVLDIVGPFGLFLSTAYQGLGASFQIPFLIHLHVLSVSLFTLSLANCPCFLFAVHSFFCSSLVFLNSLGSTVSSFVIVVLTAASNGSRLFLT